MSCEKSQSAVCNGHFKRADVFIILLFSFFFPLNGVIFFIGDEVIQLLLDVNFVRCLR